MTPSTDEDATPREAPEDDPAAPADTLPARGEADADADGRPAALHHPNVTDRRTTAAAAAATMMTTSKQNGCGSRRRMNTMTTSPISTS